ncbi:MAG: tetratricopeptide repeat protein [Planctomycetota bacterium]
MNPARPRQPEPGHPGRRNEILVVAGLALLAFLLRLIYLLNMRENPGFDHPIMDAAYHVDWARALASGQDFQPGPFFRAPLYPWFLTVVRVLFGEGLFVPRLIQCLLGAATAVLCYMIGRRAFDARVGLLAGLSAATYWVLIYFDAELLLPTLLVPLSLAALYVTLGLAKRPTPSRAACAGLLFGLSAICRPNILLFMPLVALWLWLFCPKRTRAGLIAAAAFSLSLLAPILPLTAYNYFVGHDTVLISSQAGVNFWIGNNPDSDGGTAIVPGTRAGWWEGYHDAIRLAEHAEGRSLKPSEVSAHYSQKAWDWILSHPGDAARHLLWKARLFFTNWELGNNQEVRFFAERFNPFVLWLPLGFPAVAGFGLLGLLLLLLLRPTATFPLTGFVVVYTASILAFFVCSRYRVPVLPVLMILGSYATFWLIDSLLQRRFLRAGAGLAAALLIAFGTTRISPYIVTTGDNGRLQLAAALAAEGRSEEAVDQYLQALAENPRNRYAAVELATAYIAMGRFDEADQTFREVLANFPFLPEAVDRLLNLRIDAKHLQAAELLAEEAERHDPNLPHLAYNLGRIRAAQGRISEALAYFRTAVKEEPDAFNANYSLARLLELGEDPKQAIPYYRRALDAATFEYAPHAEDAKARLRKLVGQ